MSARVRVWSRCAVAVVLLLALPACGGGGNDPAAGGDQEHEHGHDHGGDAAAVDFGAAAAEADADRRIRIVASEPFEFRPERVEVAAGEVVTFVVTNEGRTLHEFVIGDEDYQHAHAEEMAGGHGHGGEGNAVTMEPGETARLTWKFTEPGELLFVCHQPGHFPGGMVGVLEVGSA